MATVVSYGGGINSTALLILIKRANVIPDAILFADTGGERKETYEYVKHFSIWLQRFGMPPIETVKYKTKDGELLTLEQDVINNKTLPSIAFGWKSCSEKFKIRPQAKYIAEKFSNHDFIHHYIGFDAGERHRIIDNPLEGHYNHYTLYDAGLDRDGCVRLIKDEGLPIPPKSSCIYCPNMKKHEILSLSSEEKERVKIIEANAKNKVEMKGLGRQYSWTDLINADESQLKLFDDLDMYNNPCGCVL